MDDAGGQVGNGGGEGREHLGESVCRVGESDLSKGRARAGDGVEELLVTDVAVVDVQAKVVQVG